jgi:glucuronate isomerase
MRRYNVKVVCTTDDPVDSLEYHKQVKESGFEIKMLPTWRPDKAMAVEVPADFRAYVEKLAQVSGVTINKFQDMIDALQKRHDFFESMGCKLSDHGIEEFYAEDYTDAEIEAIFNKVYGGTALTQEEILKFKSAMMIVFAEMDYATGWAQQFHYGAIRNNNSKMFKLLGPDTGFDSIGEFNTAKACAKYLDKLNSRGKLTKTILYNLNPCANEVLATMLGNFQDGSIAGKIQLGSGWWFLDQKDGMQKQMNALSVLGLLSRFVGMLTDSRSFLSYPRHEYFRRTLCNLLGTDIENGEIPYSGYEAERINQMVEDICYNNAKEYFKF